MYKCEYCGKEFEKLQGLSAHKGHCKLNPNNTKEKLKKRYKEISLKGSKTIIENHKIKFQQEELTRKERKLVCQRCRKEYILNLTDKEFENNKYSKFCSRSCANTRQHSEETKKKIGEHVKKSEIYKTNNLLAIQKRVKEKDNNTIFDKNGHKIYHYICKECGKEYTNLDNRNINSKIYCSKECKHKYLSDHTGGYRIGSGYSKSGWYKGIRCDSTWELAFLIYHLDNNLYIERCNEQRKYIWKGKEHIYYPDFVTDKGIIEIKGYKTKQSEEKRKQNPDIINIFKEDIQFYLGYVHNKYNKSLIELYDNSKPNVNFLNNEKYIWVYNENLQKNTMIYPEKYEEYITNGWKHGRKKFEKH